MRQFECFKSGSLNSEVVDNTNIYAEQILSAEAYKQFQLVTMSEFQAYLGFMFPWVSTIYPFFDYWKTNCTRVLPIVDHISCIRFLEIARFLHSVDNTTNTTHRTDPQFDRMWKVRPITNASHRPT